MPLWQHFHHDGTAGELDGCMAGCFCGTAWWPCMYYIGPDAGCVSSCTCSRCACVRRDRAAVCSLWLICILLEWSFDCSAARADVSPWVCHLGVSGGCQQKVVDRLTVCIRHIYSRTPCWGCAPPLCLPSSLAALTSAWQHLKMLLLPAILFVDGSSAVLFCTSGHGLEVCL